MVIHDDLWCADAGKYGARCFTAVSGQEIKLNKYEWDKLRVAQICTATQRPGEGFVNVRTPLEQLCADTNVCTAEQKKVLDYISKKADAALKGTEGSDPFGGQTAPPK